MMDELLGGVNSVVKSFAYADDLLIFGEGNSRLVLEEQKFVRKCGIVVKRMRSENFRKGVKTNRIFSSN